ncbi:OmpA family protein [Chitinophaga vietnamensis]|uniref:OmpA family protein n=1 Tax=Chitinophaga vietnamensis TaxID=2593957 RepID=UPI001177DDE1|nr:OmpA family protein [Chitinophaga vietnamensis]
MKRKFYVFIFLLYLVLSPGIPAIAQSAAKLVKQADRAYAQLRFAAALELYHQANAQQGGDPHTIKHIALLEQELQHYKECLPWFAQINYDKEAPSWLLLYVQALSSNEQYERADSCLRVYRMRTQQEAPYNFSQVDQLFRDSSQWQIQYASLNSTLDEFSPALFGHNLVFVTNQYLSTGIKRVYARDEKPFLQLRMVTDTAGIKYTDIRKMSFIRNDDVVFRYVFNDDDTYPTSNDSKVAGLYRFRYQDWKGVKRPGWNNGVNVFDNHVNTKYHEGPVTFSSLFDTLYFTRNNYVPGRYRTDKQGINRLKVYSAVYRSGGWEQIKEFPFDSDDYSTAHPALSKDGSTLFFVSDMPGGYGGKDIYYVTKAADGSWNKPVNAGPQVNTSGDELFPFIDARNNLYFSSNGRMGLGGLDIYRVRWAQGAASGVAENLGYPMNTSKDDFGIWCTEDESGLHGFFSSNRYGDDDVFRFRSNPLQLRLSGTVFNRITSLRQQGVTVSLIRNGESRDTLTSLTGNFGWPLLPNTDYEIRAEMKGMKKVVLPFSTKGIDTDSLIHHDLFLEPLPDGALRWPKNCDSLRRLYAMPDIFFDLDSYAIRPDALPVLNKLAAMLRQDTALSLVIASYTDARASVAYNNRLSERRSRSVAAWLENAGIAPARLTVQYFGETRLRNGCKDNVPCPEYLHQQNRRSEFYFVKDGINITQECVHQ